MWKKNPWYRNWEYVKSKPKKMQTSKHLKACRDYKKKFVDKYWYLYCEKCWINYIDATRMETHHIVYASEAPLNKNLHNEKNLILLCIKCHNELHSHKSLRNGLVKERWLNELFWRNLIIEDKNIFNKN